MSCLKTDLGCLDLVNCRSTETDPRLIRLSYSRANFEDLRLDSSRYHSGRCHFHSTRQTRGLSRPRLHLLRKGFR